MKALVLVARNQLEYGDLPEPDCAADEVIVEVKACGVCGSDVHGMDGSSGRRIPPLVMGHEASGVIARAGENVEGWQPGDRVTFDSTIWCGQCGFCRGGQVNLCDRREVLGVACSEFRRDGAFAQWVAVPARILCRLPEGVSFEQAAMAEPVSIAVHAVERVRPHLNDTAVVIGSGMIGLLIIQALRLAGCGLIIAVDIRPARLELARRLGADVTLSPERDDVSRTVLDRTAGRGADVAFEAAGFPATVAMAIDSVRKGGRVGLVGNLTPTVDLPLQRVVTREVTLYGSCASAGEYPTSLDLIARGAIRVDPLVSAVAPLAEGAQWFQRLRSGADLMKVLLRP
ncbi:MAG TPA: galactitol-1-phosphate 5-dehydrogenase [Planctomycetes bacterium]|nr:galactitol-1-phosphate 5-dehydrogenase [Planctomycetota bacterium]